MFNAFFVNFILGNATLHATACRGVLVWEAIHGQDLAWQSHWNLSFGAKQKRHRAVETKLA